MRQSDELMVRMLLESTPKSRGQVHIENTVRLPGSVVSALSFSHPHLEGEAFKPRCIIFSCQVSCSGVSHSRWSIGLNHSLKVCCLIATQEVRGKEVRVFEKE